MIDQLPRIAVVGSFVKDQHPGNQVLIHNFPEQGLRQKIVDMSTLSMTGKM
jgi:hypothetical protein